MPAPVRGHREDVDERLPVGKAVVALSLEAAHDHVLGSERRLAEDAARDLRRLAADLRLPDLVPRARERRSAGLPLVHETAEAVDVGPEVERDAAEELLGRGVRRRAEDDHRPSAGGRLHLALAERRRDAPVGDRGAAALVEENVLGLEVAVHDVVLHGRPVESAGDAHDRPVEELGVPRGHLRPQAPARHPPRADDRQLLEREDAERLDDPVADGERQPDLELRRGSARSPPCCRARRAGAPSARSSDRTGVCRTRAQTPIPPRMTSTTVNVSESNPCVRASAGRDSSSPGRNGTTCRRFSHSPARDGIRPKPARPSERRMIRSEFSTEVSMNRTSSASRTGRAFRPSRRFSHRLRSRPLPGTEGRGARPLERDEAPPRPPARRAVGLRRLGRPGRERQRAPRHHRDQPPLRAHDVQGDDDDRDEGRRRGTWSSSPSRRGSAASCATRTSKMRAALRRGEIDDITKPENKTAAVQGAREEVRRAREGAARPPRQERVRPDLHEAGRLGDERLRRTDITHYFVTVPKNKLELWMWMESDRLKAPVFREFYAERDVVFEERRLRTESTPTGRLDEAFEEMFWHGHPYTWPVVGYASDIPAITKAAGRRVLRALLRAEQHHRHPRRRLRPEGGPRAGRAVLRADPAREEPAARDDDPAAEVGSRDALQRRGGHEPAGRDRLAHRPLPAQGLLPAAGPRAAPERPHGPPLQGDGRRRRAPSRRTCTASAFSRKYAGEFGVDAEVKDGKTPEDAEKAIYAEIEKLKKDLVPAEELQKVKNNFAAQVVPLDAVEHGHPLPAHGQRGPRRLEGVQRGPEEDPGRDGRGRAPRRADVPHEGEPRRRDLHAQGRAPAAAGHEDPALAAVPEQMRPMVKQTLARLAAATDADKLKQMIAQMESQSAQMPPQMKPAADLILQKARERLTELETTPKTREEVAMKKPSCRGSRRLLAAPRSLPPGALAAAPTRSPRSPTSSPSSRSPTRRPPRRTTASVLEVRRRRLPRREPRASAREHPDPPQGRHVPRTRPARKGSPS